MRLSSKFIIGIDEVGRAASLRRASPNKFIIGIDEVGRGAVAGPLVIGAACGRWNGKLAKSLKGVRDSKRLTPRQREIWFKKFKKMPIKFYTVSIGNALIDKNGISWALREGIAKLLKKSKKKPDLVLLDGGIHAPKKYIQKTIIRGDDKIPLISAASIYAKVTRDRLMVKLDKRYSHYGFKNHKGYGTADHLAAVKKNGVSKIHRKSFLKNL